MALLKNLLYLLVIFFPLTEIAKVKLVDSVSLSLNDIFVGLIFISILVLYLKKKIVMKGKLTRPIAIFVLVAFVSLVLNVFNYPPGDLFVSFLYLFRWIAYAFIYLSVVNLVTQERKYLIKLLKISGCIAIFLSFVQYAFYQDLGNLFYLNWDKHLYRLFGTFLDPNFAGTFFSIFTIFIAGSLANEKDNKNKIIYWIIIVFSVIAVILTYSRSALIMLVISSIIFLVLSKKTKYILLFLAVLIIAILFSPKIFQTEGTNLFRTYSSLERVGNARIALEIFSKNPIFGTGFNTYRYAQYRYGFLKGDKWTLTHSGSGADNSYLFILATTGVAGFIAYVLLAKKMYLAITIKKNNQWGSVSISILTGLLINAIFNNSLFFPPIMLWLWLTIGITESS